VFDGILKANSEWQSYLTTKIVVYDNDVQILKAKNLPNKKMIKVNTEINNLRIQTKLDGFKLIRLKMAKFGGFFLTNCHPIKLFFFIVKLCNFTINEFFPICNKDASLPAKSGKILHY